MATHSSILAWKIPWTEEPGGLQFMELQRVGHDWATNTHSGPNVNLSAWGKNKENKTKYKHNDLLWSTDNSLYQSIRMFYIISPET